MTNVNNIKANMFLKQLKIIKYFATIVYHLNQICTGEINVNATKAKNNKWS